MKTALIYTRGNNGIEQLEKCERYAESKGYTIEGVTTNLDDVFKVYPDVLLVSDVSRITRNRFDYENIERVLKSNGIAIEQTA